MNRLLKRVAVAILSATAMALLTTGCVGCKYCGGGDDGKPVAPEIYSDETGADGEPSLPYLKPWWKD